MKRLKILVPTDFSKFAHNALDFAIEFFKFYNIEIILFHSIVYYDNSELNKEENSEIEKQLHAESISKICAESDFIKSKNHNIYVKILIDKGEVELKIANVIDREKIDYIVMGTQGQSGLKPTVFGSFASNILVIASCPVFTVPLTKTYKDIKKIVCLTEMDESEMGAIKQSIILARRYNAEIVFYNVSAHPSRQSKRMSEFKTQLEELSDYPVEYITEQSDHTLKPIENFICETSPDLIITLGKERNFWDRLFSKKVTKKLCLHTSVPLLSFPESFEDDKIAA